MAEHIEREKYVKLNDIIETLEHEWGYKGMREDLYNLPTADVVEVKHGRWIEKKESLCFDYVTLAVCSVCGKGQSVSSAFPFKSCVKLLCYCPLCGAKMDLKEGAEE